MRRSTIISLIAAVPVVLLIAWVARNTYWADTKVPMPPKGEALTNPFYAVQRFAEALGARTAWDRLFRVPPAGSVIVLSGWHWSLSAGRREALEHWVESGGRLVVDGALTGGEVEFERWSGIVHEHRFPNDKKEETAVPEREDPCGSFLELLEGAATTRSDDEMRVICDVEPWSSLSSNQVPAWALGGASGIQAMRLRVGRGSVTMINASPFRYRNLFDGDHGWLFVAATELRPDDEVHFLADDDHPSLLALLWQYGSPVVVLALALVALVLWRGAVRFGPLAAPASAARRSLAEQIRGTGQFALRHGGGESLHAASVRALGEAARRRIPGYARLSATERAAALAAFTGFEPKAIASAIYHPRWRRAHPLRSSIALVESARRQTLIEHTRSTHGTT